MKYKLQKANLNTMKKEPELIWDSRNLPIPIDAFKVSKTPTVESEYSHDSALLSDISLWVTIGPTVRDDQIRYFASRSEMKTIRISASKYSSPEELKECINYCADCKKYNNQLELCIDTGGPKVRITRLEDVSNSKFVDIFKNDKIALVHIETLNRALENEDLKDSIILPIDSKVFNPFHSDFVFISDGWLQLRIVREDIDIIHCRAMHDSRIYNRRGIDIPGMYDNLDPVIPKDIDLFTGLGDAIHKIDLFALSFTNRADDIERFRDVLSNIGITGKIVAKVETKSGIQNISDIASSSDAVMIARGDLAVQLAPSRTDMLAVEDDLLDACRRAETRCIIATRVADSLENGNTSLNEFEIYRLYHELSLRTPLELMLANETINGDDALTNYDIVLRVLQQLSSHFIDTKK